MNLCPFCGENEAESLVVTSKTVQPIIAAQVECLNCGARGPLHYNIEGPKSADEGAVWVWDNERVGVSTPTLKEGQVND